MSTLTRRRFLLSSSAGGLPFLTGACPSGSTPPPPSPSPAPEPPGQPRERARGDEGFVLAATWSWGLTACREAVASLRGGGSLLDAAEAGVRAVELDPAVETVGVGGIPNEEGDIELDAMVMIGSSLECGAVAALRGIATPISVARRVMERTRHILLVGEPAQRFAVANGFPVRDIHTDASRRRHREWVAAGRPNDFHRGHETVGFVGCGRGEVIVAMSTSGLGFKLAGRVGDSPIVGAGGYADAEVGAACATGVGEEVIRTAGSHAVVEAMRRGLSPDEAAAEVARFLRRRRGAQLGDAQVAFIALRRDGLVGAAALRPGFEMAVHRDGATTMVRRDPLPA
jgi:isoaspartyl peptidase/L-asparaginase-like protein (Ntn-hydrolase superfamily)